MGQYVLVQTRKVMNCSCNSNFGQPKHTKAKPAWRVQQVLVQRHLQWSRLVRDLAAACWWWFRSWFQRVCVHSWYKVVLRTIFWINAISGASRWNTQKNAVIGSKSQLKKKVLYHSQPCQMLKHAKELSITEAGRWSINGWLLLSQAIKYQEHPSKQSQTRLAF